MIFILLDQGLGRPMTVLDLAKITYDLKIVFAGEILWAIGSSLVRFSALAFYGRIFRVRTYPGRVWKIVFYTVCTLSVLWTVAIVLYSLLSCRPISASWTFPAPAGSQCVDNFTNFLVGDVGDFINDFIILLLPLPQVFKLNLKLRKRIAISISFILGYG
jgi:hypothetical protein